MQGEKNYQGEKNKTQDCLPVEEGKEAANEVENHELRIYVFVISIKLMLLILCYVLNFLVDFVQGDIRKSQ